MATYSFISEMWLWQSNGGTAWTFITLPQDVSEEIEDKVPMKGGLGSVKVDVTIGPRVEHIAVSLNGTRQLHPPDQEAGKGDGEARPRAPGQRDRGTGIRT